VRPGRRRKNYDDVKGLAMRFPPSSTKYLSQENRTMTSKTTKTCGIRIKSRVKAGAIASNHNQVTKGLRVKSRIKAGFNFTKICF
jgi:hypothetical protein